MVKVHGVANNVFIAEDTVSGGANLIVEILRQTLLKFCAGELEQEVLERRRQRNEGLTQKLLLNYLIALQSFQMMKTSLKILIQFLWMILFRLQRHPLCFFPRGILWLNHVPESYSPSRISFSAEKMQKKQG